MRPKSNNQFNNIFAGTDDPNDLLKKLFIHSNATKKQQHLVDLLGLKSKGVVSEFVNNKRNIPLKHLKKIASYFDLDANQYKILECLIKLKGQQKPQAVESLKTNLAHYRKSLLAKRGKLSKYLVDTPLAFEVFSSFGLLDDDEISFERIELFFGKEKARELKKALKVLEKLKLVARRGNYYSLSEDNILFDQFSSLGPPVRVIEYFMERTKQDVKDWFEQKDSAYFASSMISTKKASYKQTLKQIKAQLEAHQNDLEAHEADMLISFNTQIYPIAEK